MGALVALVLFSISIVAAPTLALPDIIRCDENVGYAGAAYPVGALIDTATASTTTTSVLEMRTLAGMSVQVDYGAITGTIALQASNDNVTYYSTADDFTAPAGSPGGYLVELAHLRARFYRLVYTHSSGTGLLKLTVYVKGKD